MSLTSEQQKAVEHRGGSLIVSAAAGAGKTTVLVSRVLSLLCDPAQPCDISQLLIVTFTNAAASELRDRIGEQLSLRLADEPGNAHLRRQLALLGGAPIGTVHSFCQRLLRQHFHRVGLSPDFRLADENECAALRERALASALEELYAEASPEFMALAEQLSDGRSDRALEKAVTELYDKLRSHPDPDRWLEYAVPLAAADPDAASWCRALRTDAAERLDAETARLRAAREEMRGTEIDAAYGGAFDALLAFADVLRPALAAGWDEARESLFGFEKPKLKAARKGDKALIERMKTAREHFTDVLEDFKKLFSVTTAQIRAESAVCASLTAGMCAAVRRFTEHYDALKRSRNCVDFSDLEHLTLRLLYTPDDALTETARELRASLREIMVDEYQDTNEVQERIYRALLPEDGAGFFVGDVKQSIYRFRLAEPEIFLDRCREAERHPERQQRLDLPDNFRSRAEVLSLCNFVFSRTMSGAFGGVDYTDGHQLRPGDPEAAAGECCPSELWLLESPTDEEEKNEEHEARACADIVVRMLNEERLPDGDGTRAARPEDFAILLSSYAGKADYFARALEERGVPCARGGGGFFGSMEIAVMTSYLRLLDDPRQDIPLVSVLRSPLWLFSAEELARLRLRAGGGLYDALLASEDDPHCRAFLAQLHRFRAYSRDLPLPAVLAQMYDELRAEAIFSAMDDGARRAQRLRRLLQMTAGFEAGDSRGVAPFLRWLDQKARRGDPEDAAASSGGVRIMSIHKAKGLEFPFVLLPDLGKKFNEEDLRTPVLIHTDLGLGFQMRDRARRIEWPSRLRMAVAGRMRREAREEELRKLYVAMTRAKRKLVLVASHSKPEEYLAALADEVGGRALSPHWLREQNNACRWVCAALLPHPDAGALRQYVHGIPTPEDPPTGQLRCHVMGEPIEQPRYCPPTERQPQLFGDADALMARAGEHYAFEEVSALPSKLTPTGVKRLLPETGELTGTPEAPEAHAWRQERIVPRAQRTAARRGTALHLLLRHTDPAACRTPEDAQKLLEELTARGILLPEDAALCAPQAALDFARSSLGRRMTEAAEVLREYEFGVLLDAASLLPGGPEGERLLVNGAIDLLMVEDGQITIVDFKSDRVRPGGEQARAAEHRLQLQVYARAAEELFGLPVRECWVWFTETGTGVCVE